jgi:hypothetical protein
VLFNTSTDYTTVFFSASNRISLNSTRLALSLSSEERFVFRDIHDDEAAANPNCNYYDWEED